MAITISGENNNDKILASDGVIDSLSALNIAGIVTATTFVGNLTGNVTGNVTGDVGGNLTGNVTGNINNSTLLLQTGGYERLRITSDGKVSVGNESSPLGILHVKEGDSGVTSADTSQDTLFLESNGNAGLTIATPNANTGYLTFADPEDSNIGQIIYRHSDNSMSMFVNAAERLRIASGGQVIIGDDDTDKANGNFDDLIVGANASSTETHGITIVCGNAATNGGIAFSDGSAGGADAYRGMISYQHNDNHMQFRTNAVERLRITSTGIIDAPTQTGFYARMQNDKNNVMGGGAAYYTVLFDSDSGSICYNQDNAYATGTGLYTVPAGGDGHYLFSTAVCLSTDAYGRAGEAWFLVGSNRYFFDRKYFTSTSGTITGYYGTSIIKLTAGQTVGVQAFVSGGSTDVDVLAASSANQITWFTGRKIP